jgi:serine/threonine-protein kinase PknG
MWVVLKGMLDSNDEAAMEAAIAERRFLAEVNHPNIVNVLTFAEHNGAGYTVMEYVGGESLRDLRNRHRRDAGEPLPVAQAVAFILEILPAFAYLHDRGLLYCDFKPDNVIQTDDRLTLIDLGAVRRIDDQVSDHWGTVGYQAPEVRDQGESVSSDLYTVARTLAILCADIPGFHDEDRNATSLPTATQEPRFARYEALYQFLLKATATDPDARFDSAGEMAEQLLGVLRQVVAIDGGEPAPAASRLFSGELGHGTGEGSWENLPIPAIDPLDPSAGLLTTLAAADSEQIRAALELAPRTTELILRLARTWMEEGNFADAERELESPELGVPDWRVAWWRGVLQLAAGHPKDAESFFAVVAAELPGELPPKLAMALAYEVSSDDIAPAIGAQHAVHTNPLDARVAAEHYYDLVAATNPTYVSASFGLARIRTASGNRSGALAALERVPQASSAYVAAQISMCRIDCAHLNGAPPTPDDLIGASNILARLNIDASTRLPLKQELLTQALDLLMNETASPDIATVLDGSPFVEDDLRFALEHAYRSLAKLASSDAEQVRLVDLANASRPRTLT